MLRAIALVLFVYTGPLPNAPALQTQTIKVIIPAHLAANTPVCTLT